MNATWVTGDLVILVVTAILPLTSKLAKLKSQQLDINIYVLHNIILHFFIISILFSYKKSILTSFVY